MVTHRNVSPVHTWFSEFHSEYEPRVRGFFVAKLGVDHRVDDLTQATFEALYSRALAGGIDRSRDLWPLVAAVASRRLVDERRRSGRRASTVSLAELDGLADDGQDVPRVIDLRDSVQLALNKLPPAYREVLVLHGVHDLSDADLMAVTGRTHGAVRVLLTRARERFRYLYDSELLGLGFAVDVVRRARSLARRASARAHRRVAMLEGAAVVASRAPLEIGGIAVVLLASAALVPLAPTRAVTARLDLVSAASAPAGDAVTIHSVTASQPGPGRATGQEAGRPERARRPAPPITVDAAAPAVAGVADDHEATGTVDPLTGEAFLGVAVETPIGPVTSTDERRRLCDGDMRPPREDVEIAGAARIGAGCPSP